MSVWIDDIYVPDIGVMVLEGGSEPALPSTRDRSITIPGRPGAYDLGGELGVRQFEIPFAISGPRDHNLIAGKAREFARLFLNKYGKPKTVKLRFDSEPDRFYYVRYSGSLPVERVAYTAKFTVPLTAFDPYAKSLATNDEVTWGSEEITFESQYLLGHNGGGQQVVFTSAGSTNVTVDGEMVRPIITVTGSGTNVAIRANDNAMSIGTFANKTFVIDCEKYTVSVNGTYSLSSMVGNFIELFNGDNTIQVSGSGLNLTIAINFRDQYI